ncbi:E3 ubiquitin-protein ligase CHFR-like isoform X2 [Dreissena polymorpha]|uniref:E3 ubiquitin-protein ligase CHFR-like isoform X2 n=1 Tax=Dreissena polymorpha TaxID=45954 RepID=UPI0022642D64|nr:E3 ubiquitin-protein ligase CHFR-like isoform X2 [Dreissena polymorpha]
MSVVDAWGQLVSLSDYESPPFQCIENVFRIGRAVDNDISLSENKLVSGHHCYLMRDEASGVVTLHDSSTNGTLLNMTYKLTKGKSKELQHGDEFYVVYKKENEEFNVGFVYQDCAELRKAELEESGTQEYSAPDLLDATLEDSDCNYISPEKSTLKRKSSVEGIVENGKKPKLQLDTKVAESTTKPHTTLVNESKPRGQSTGTTHIALSSSTATTAASLATAAPVLAALDTSEAASSSEAASKLASKTAQEITVAAKATTSTTATRATASLKIPEKDDIEENLQCTICQDIMHDCISLQPCLHSFCAGCYSEWMSRSQECPSCRKKVERINKNHIVNNLIEAYLKEHPAKRRPAEDIVELNKKNKITNDMLYPKNQIRNNEDSSDYSDTDDDSDDDNYDGPAAPHGLFFHAPVIAPPAPVLYGFGTPVFGVNRAFKTVCRQCPDYKDPNGGNSGDDKNVCDKTSLTNKGNQNGEGNPGNGTEGGPAAGPSEPAGDGKAINADVKQCPDPPAHVCPINQNHVLCQCCLQPMPDFRVHWPHLGVEKRPQQCAMCYRAYCHAYWGCRKQDCLGCLNVFRDMNFGRKALNGLILDNQVESDIFRDYIDSKGLSVKDVLQECCRKLEAGVFTVIAQGTHQFRTETAVCYACGLASFKQLALQYRKSIKKEDLPGTSTTFVTKYDSTEQMTASDHRASLMDVKIKIPLRDL